MDPFHERLARVALEVTAAYGFALAGGYAVQAHGFLDRPSSDVDLFAEASADFNFSNELSPRDAAQTRPLRPNGHLGRLVALGRGRGGRPLSVRRARGTARPSQRRCGQLC